MAGALCIGEPSDLIFLVRSDADRDFRRNLHHRARVGPGAWAGPRIDRIHVSLPQEARTECAGYANAGKADQVRGDAR